MLFASARLPAAPVLKPAVIGQQPPVPAALPPRPDGTYVLFPAMEEAPGIGEGYRWTLSVPPSQRGAYRVSVEYAAAPRTAGGVLTVSGGASGSKTALVLSNTGGPGRFGVTMSGSPLTLSAGTATVALDADLTGHDGALAVRRVILTPIPPSPGDVKKNTPRVDSTAFQIVGYLPEYRALTVPLSVADDVTQLIFFSLEPTPDGGIDAARLTPEIADKLRQIQARARVPIMAAFGGGDRSQTFGPMAVDPGARRLFVMDLLQFVIRSGFQGVDFDWEFPDTPREHAALSDLICETKAAFAPYGLQVSAALAPWDDYDARSLAAVDQLNYMTYTDDTHHAPLSHAQADTEDMIRKGAAPGKICMGIPFYGENVSGKGDGLAYSEIVRQYHPAPNVDEVNGVGFNGIDTIRAKVRYALKRRLRGVMIWELGQDTEDGELAKAIRNIVDSVTAHTRAKDSADDR